MTSDNCYFHWLTVVVVIDSTHCFNVLTCCVTDCRLMTCSDCLQDEGSFQMKSATRDVLTHLGSDKAGSLGWRDTWVMVTIKGGKPWGGVTSKYDNTSLCVFVILPAELLHSACICPIQNR